MAKKKRIPKKVDKVTSKKLALLFLLVMLALAALAVRIVYINTVSGNSYKIKVLSQAQSQYENSTLPAKRGDIYDRNGNLLATSNKVYNVILDCKVVNEKSEYIEPTVRALVKMFDLDEDKMRSLITSESTRDSQYQIIKRKISMDEQKAFASYKSPGEDEELTDSEKEERRNIKGIWFEEDYLRTYPYNSLAADTIGFTLARDTADTGLEGYYNSTLSGSDGRKYGYINSDSDVEQTIIDATDGYSIQTTLDVGVQKIVEKYVNGFQKSMGAKHVGVIVEKPSTGEILAMDGGDRYDLNNPRDLSLMYSKEEIAAMNDEETVNALNSIWSNFCVTDAYEPGSVVKPLVVAASLEKGAITESDTFLCDGFEMFGAEGNQTMIKCAVYPNAHGQETLGDVIANSCNDGMMQIAAKMGAEQFIKTQSLFNLGTRTGIDLPNEGTGIVHTAESMGSTELACSAFGQGYTLTMIQEINAICSVINGGYYYQPRLVSKITDREGKVIKSYTPTLLKQTISSRISGDVRSYMELSVKQGTSATSKVEGYSSGGKTGTAEKFPRGQGNYLVSFIGFAPVDNPQVVIYVVVDEPNTEDQASSSYAQYIAQGILSELLPYLNVAPDEASDGYVPSTELWEGFNGHLKSGDEVIQGEDGKLYDSAGNLVDWSGNRIDAEGYLLDSNGNYQYDEGGNKVMSGSLENPDGSSSAYSGGNVTNDGISDSNVPGPLDDEDEELSTNEDNDQESEGVTNEEADMG